jgi:hypothetical protein
MGAVSDILKVYALENTSRLTRGATVQERNASAVLRFQPPLKVVACTSRTISVAVDVSPNAAAGSEHAFKVKSGKDFQSDTRVSFLSETKQGVITTKPKSVGLVTFTPLPTASRNVLFGTDRTLLRFSLKATSQTKMQVDAISFTNNGSARNTDIVQLSVKRRDGRLLSDVAATLTDDGVRLIFSTPFVLEKNETHVLTLSGNVTASRRRTIDFTVSEPGDIETREAPRS